MNVGCRLRKLLGNFLILVASAGLLTSCSEEDDYAATDGTEKPQAYFQLYLDLPTSSTRSSDTGITTATETTDITEDTPAQDSGTDAEAQIKSARIFLFTTKDKKSYANNPLRVALLSIGTSETAKKFRSDIVRVDAETYDAYVVINDTTNYTKTYTTESEFLAKATHSASLLTAVPNNGMPMSGRDNTIGAAYSLTVTEKNDALNPAGLSITAERSYAKLTYSGTETTFDLYQDANVDNSTIGKVTLQGYYVMNVMTSYYIFRHVGNIESSTVTTTYQAYGTTYSAATEKSGAVVNSTYVYDPYSTAKGYNNNALTGLSSYYSNSVGGLVSGKTKTESITASSIKFTTLKASSTLGYVPENVMTYSNQKKGYATGVIFKAKLSPSTIYKKEVVTGTVVDSETQESSVSTSTTIVPLTAEELTAYGNNDLYYYQPVGKFYNSMEALMWDNNLSSTDFTEEMQQTASRRNKFGVYCYAKGICYYPYYLRHYTPTDEERSATGRGMQAMEFAVVRNNEYRMSVKRVALRAAEDIDITPTEDVLLNEVYMTATITVAPWVVRVNAMTLGGF